MRGAIFGLGTAMVLSVVFVGVLTLLISKESISIQTVTLATVIMQLLSAFVGCVITGQVVYESKVLASGVVALAYYVLLIGTSALFLDGISGDFWIGFIAIAAGFMAALYLSVREKSSGKRSKRRRAYS